MFSISRKLRNSDVSVFRKLQTPTFFVISHSFIYFTFHLWLRSLPLFHVIILAYILRSLSVPGTYLSHSLVYKHLYSVARITRIKITTPTTIISISSFVLSLLLEILKISLPLAYSSSPTRYSFPDPEILESGNSHALSHSEIRDPWGIPQGTGQYPESAPVTRIRYFILLLITSFSYSLDPFRIQFVTIEPHGWSWGKSGPDRYWGQEVNSVYPSP